MINLAEDNVMDAAQKPIRNSALFLISTLMLAAPGWCLAQPTLVLPSTVTVTSTGVNSAPATSSDGSTQIPFTIGAVNYGAGTTGWLTVNGDTTTPGTESFHVFGAASLTPCTTATVTFTPTTAQSGSTTWSLTPQTVTVIWANNNTNCSGGNTGGSTSLTAHPTSPAPTKPTQTRTIALKPHSG